MNSFEASVFSALESLPLGAVLLAAVSGGADSMAMLEALAEFREKSDAVIRALHVEHGMRPARESKGDAAFVCGFCRRRGIPCRVIAVPPGRIEKAGAEWGTGPEGAARFFRIRALNREARRVGACRILIAHTRDDALEHILIRILRGSGPSGLASLPKDNGWIVRPLLDLTRRDVLQYLAEKNSSFRTDSTNADIRFFRNRVRHKLIPCLDAFFPSWRSSLPLLAETQTRAADFITAEAARRVCWNPGSASGDWWTDGNAFFSEPAIIQEEAVFQASDKNESKGKKFSVPRRRSLRRFLEARNEKNTAADLGPFRLEKKEDRICVTRTNPGGFQYSFTLLLDAPGDYDCNGLRISVVSPGTETPGGFCVFLPLVVRPWQKGDFIVRAGHKRRLSDIVKKGPYAGGSGFGYSGFMSAEDGQGVAAFIRVEAFNTPAQTPGLLPGTENTALLFCRDDIPHPSGYKFYVRDRFTGGTDV